MMWSPKNSHCIKRNSQLLGCACFLSWPLPRIDRGTTVVRHQVAVKACSPNHWTTRAFPKLNLKNSKHQAYLSQSNPLVLLSHKVSTKLSFRESRKFIYKNLATKHIKESACNVGDLGSIFGLGRSPWERNGNLLQYSGLENSMDCIVHRITKSRTRLSDFHSLTHSATKHSTTHTVAIN